MGHGFYKIKKIVIDLEKNQPYNVEVKLLQELIESAEAYKKQLMPKSDDIMQEKTVQKINDLNIRMEKISEETFLYKAVMVKNYYEGDYLERFSEVRTSDLKTSGAFDVHNKFWQAHEVSGGNIFASIPLALINHTQSSTLQQLNWDPVKVDVYEITKEFQPKTTKGQIITTVAKMFDHHLLVREVYGDVLMVLHYRV